MDDWDEKIINGYQVLRSDRVIWVNSPLGMVGRFSKYGVDIHSTVEDTHCLNCKPGPVNLGDWEEFRADMIEHYGVEIPSEMLPPAIRFE